MRRFLKRIEWGFESERKGDSIPLFDQVHGNTLLQFSETGSMDAARKHPVAADGAFATFPRAELSVYTADCFPLLFFTEDSGGPIAAVHAGWRGLKAGIVKNAISFFSEASRLHVVVGPAIRSCCFTVREDFISEWDAAGLGPQRFLSESIRGNHFDLLAFLLKNELESLDPDKIHLEDHRCTCCSSPSLPSFRRNKSANPRIRSWIRKLD